jgi:NADP-dependent 3-hydroxy acid dehydrogenase YdfG
MSKSVLITGSTSGIGIETALLFAEKGYLVFATGRNERVLKKLREEHSSKNIQWIKMDVTN